MTTDDTFQERIAEAVRQALSDGEALQCTRVWEAWLYKTMTDEDFTDASDGPLVEEVAAAVLPLITAEVRKGKADAFDEGQKSGLRYAGRAIAAYKIDRPDLPGPPSPNPYREQETP